MFKIRKSLFFITILTVFFVGNANSGTKNDIIMSLDKRNLSYMVIESEKYIKVGIFDEKSSDFLCKVKHEKPLIIKIFTKNSEKTVNC